MATIKCIGVLTSGGDAPGMNAAIRSVTRTAIYHGIRVKGIYRGYKGLITGEIEEFETQHVSNIIQRGGTILKTARCPEFRNPEGRKLAYETMRAHGIDALVVIGGDGSLSGARAFAEEFDFPIVGLPATIDNDLYGTDLTIGYDTALNTIVSAVDKIRDTASSHERLFFVEVMGREAGFLALNGAMAAGAEAAIIPEFAVEKDQLAETIENGFRKTKNSSIVLVSESESTGGAMKVAERVEKEYPQFDVRVVILGHIQRGGSPSAQDRIIASRMGVAAIEALLDGQRNVMIGIVNDALVYVPFSKAIKKNKPIDKDLAPPPPPPPNYRGHPPPPPLRKPHAPAGPTQPMLRARWRLYIAEVRSAKALGVDGLRAGAVALGTSPPYGVRSDSPARRAAG